MHKALAAAAIVTAACGCKPDNDTAFYYYTPPDTGLQTDGDVEPSDAGVGPDAELIPDAGPIEPPDLTRVETGMGVNIGFYDRLLDRGGQVFQAGYQTGAWREGDDAFDLRFLSLFEPFEAIRFHQFHLVSFNAERDWSDRAQPTVDLPLTEADLLGEVKVPYEWEIRLCNLTNRDLWLPIPAMASREYIVSLAELVRAQLRPDLKVYVELSNEVWNNSYAEGGVWDPTPNVFDGQYTQALLIGQELFGHLFAETPSQFELVAYGYAYQSVQAWDAFDSVFGAESDQVVRVLSWISPERAPEGDWDSIGVLFDALGVVPMVSATERMHFAPDVMAVNAYFGLEEEPSAEPNWAHYEASLAQMDTNLAYARELLDHQGLYDVDLMAYEGGQHVLGEAAAPANRDPQMYDLYRRWLEISADRLALSMHYSLVTPYESGEAFGLKEYISQPTEDAPKWRAVVDTE